MSESLATLLQSANLLLIDGLHAFDFTLADDGSLHIEVMDGRAHKRWQFSAEQLQAAQHDPEADAWRLANEQATHMLVCLSAFSATDEEGDDDETEAPLASL